MQEVAFNRHSPDPTLKRLPTLVLMSGLGLGLGILVGLLESLVIISFGRARMSVLGVGKAPFTLTEAFQLLGVAIVIYGLSSALSGAGFDLLLHLWPRKIGNQRFLLFARWYVGFMLFLYIAVWWNKFFLEGTSLLAPLSLATTGLILIISVAIGYLLVPRLVFTWQRLRQTGPWPNQWLLAGLLVGGIIILIGINTSRGSEQGQRTTPATAGQGVNVVIITLDTTRADHLGAYGYEQAHTPNLDRWAKRGTVFWETIAQVPLTNPNHSSLFTSKYPRSHGVLYNAWLLDKTHPTLAEILSDRGYATGAFVSAFVLKTEISGLQQGFQVYDDSFSPLDRYISLMALRITNRLMAESLLEQKANVVTDKALAWLAQRPEGPFFLWVHYFDPHFPYNPPADYKKFHPPADDGDIARQIALYDGEISFVDAQVGHLLNELEAEGVMNNTILVITADHGESLDEHDYYFDHGRFLYDPSMRVPLMIIYPPAVEAGLIIQEQVQTIDIMPTLFHLLDIPPVEGMQGSLLPLSAAEKSTQRAAFGQTFPNPEEPWNEKYSIRKEGWKLIRTPKMGLTELYHLTTDPGETNNLIDEETAMGQQLEVELTEWLTATSRFEITGNGIIDSETQEQLERLGY